MYMTGCDSCGGPPLDASKDQTEGEPQLDSLLDGADAAAVEAGAEAGVETGAAEAAGTEAASTDQMDAMSQLELLLGGS
jgi:hypothetical protein